jgi:tetratricopeptide (TPR) repeat protein
VFYGHLLTILGRWEEAREEVEEAIELDPLNPFVKGLYGTHLYLTRRYDEAIEVLEETFRRHPGAAFGRAALSGSYEAVGRREAALEILTRILEGRGDAEAVAALERGRREGGYRTALWRAADIMAKKARNEYVPPFRIAELYARAGDGDEAVAWFRRALEAREQNMPYIGVIPALEGLHDDPGFREIVRSVGVPLLDGEGRVRRPR